MSVAAKSRPSGKRTGLATSWTVLVGRKTDSEKYFNVGNQATTVYCYAGVRDNAIPTLHSLHPTPFIACNGAMNETMGMWPRPHILLPHSNPAQSLLQLLPVLLQVHELVRGGLQSRRCGVIEL